MTSSSSSIASSTPATSANVVFGWSLATVLCLLRPNCITRPPPPCERFITNSRIPPISSTGRKTVIERRQEGVRGLGIDLDLDVGLVELGDQFVAVLDLVRRAVLGAVGELPGHGLLALQDLRGLDLARGHLLLEVREGDLVALGGLADERDHQQEHQGPQHDPERGRAGQTLERRLVRYLAQGRLLGAVVKMHRAAARRAPGPVDDASTGSGPAARLSGCRYRR